MTTDASTQEQAQPQTPASAVPVPKEKAQDLSRDAIELFDEKTYKNRLNVNDQNVVTTLAKLSVFFEMVAERDMTKSTRYQNASESVHEVLRDYAAGCADEAKQKLAALADSFKNAAQDLANKPKDGFYAVFCSKNDAKDIAEYEKAEQNVRDTLKLF